MFDVITIGTATRDVFLESPLFRIVRDPKHLERLGFPTGEAQCFALGGKIEIKKPAFTVGGGGANAAVTFARQGFRTGAVVKIGRDYVGDQAVRTLEGERVRMFAARDARVGTAWSAILLSLGGERTILNYRGASEDLTIKDIPFNKLSARWIYIVPGRIPFSVVGAAIKRFKAKGAKIAMDPSKYYLEMGVRKLRPILRSIDVIKMNREEASYLTGISYRDERRIFKKFDELVPGLAVMTDGPKGVLVSDGRMLYRAGVFREKKLVDRTGSGDAFGSGFVSALLRGKAADKKSIEEGIRLGTANATAVVEAIGAQAGILTKRAFAADRRWESLRIETRTL